MRLLQRAEIEVVNSILLREDYLGRLKKLLDGADDAEDNKVEMGGGHGQDGLPRDPLKRNLVEVLNLLDMIRLSTVESVEAIEKWRAAVGFARSGGEVRKGKADGQAKRLAFIWGDQNYLIKIAEDTSFLKQHEKLAAAVGFTLDRNPFLTPGETAKWQEREMRASHSAPAILLAPLDKSRVRSAAKSVMTEEKICELREEL